MHRLLVVIAALVGASLLPSAANAFCVHNLSRTTVSVLQVGGGKSFKMFSKNVAPGENLCCNWQNGDCNSSGKQDANLAFKVSFSPSVNSAGLGTAYWCGSRPPSQLSRLLGSDITVGMEAGGWMELYDHGDKAAPWNAQIYTHGGSLSYSSLCQANK